MKINSNILSILSHTEAENLFQNSSEIRSEATIKKLIPMLNKCFDINLILKKSHEFVKQDELLIISTETIELKFEKSRKKFKFKVIYYIYYIFFYIFKRFFIRLPFLSNLYWKFCFKKNYAISRAEFQGRAIYAGFEIIAETWTDDLHYLLLTKTNSPLKNQTPSYFPIIGLERVGMRGEIITIHKFRTMHPYSEYMHNYILSKNGFGELGKIKDDYRISSFGKFIRKYWVDELPQIYDILAGKLSFIGYRASSEAYFNTLPEYFQNLRLKNKPGLIPPYYADMHDSNNIIIESSNKYIIECEGRYFKKILKEPIKTNFIYFFKALFNIIFKGARSK